MGTNLPRNFSVITGELCNLLYKKVYDRERINLLIDELNAKPYKAELFVKKQDALTLITALCSNIIPTDGVLTAKTSHLINSIITKQNLQLDSDYVEKVLFWHIHCFKKCSDMVIPDLLHNIQCIIQLNPAAGQKFSEEFIGSQGVLNRFLDTSKCSLTITQNRLHICLSALKCMCSITSVPDENKTSEQPILSSDLKEQVSELVVNFLLRITKGQDEYQYCKVVVTALRVLSQIHFNDQNVCIPLPELMGISRYFLVYGLVVQGLKPEKIMPAQQTIAAVPNTTNRNSKGGKKQKLRRQRNNAIESLKKEIPVSEKSLMREVDSFENISTYRPVSQNYLEPQKGRNYWVVTSDSDASDVESSREAKLVALKSRVRQSAANLLLVLIRVTEKRDMFGYWWALLPDSPEVDNWTATDAARKTLAYCAITDPTSNNRASVLSVILALLSGPRMYLSQAEASKKDNASFIPFSVSLGYMIDCMHRVLTCILDSERSHAVILVALKCCAALLQATPYYKMRAGLVSELVRASRKFLVHKDVTVQVGALITMGCVLSIDPKVDEVLKCIEKDTAPTKPVNQIYKESDNNEECDDFEEGYSDDEMFTAVEQTCIEKISEEENTHYFKSWILDICFRNMGWSFKDSEVIKCKPSAIPVILESLQVLSAIAFHHLRDLLQPHLILLADVLFEMLQHEHQDVTLHAAKTVSVIGDAIQKLEQTNESPPVSQCVYMWQKLLTPLSTVLQCHDNPQCKATVCDCIANIGERSFKELPRHLQVLCCTLLVGSCSDEETAVRAAAVRALAMTVMFRTLREDIGFVSDCGENILRALAESSLVVRTKGAWALGNLSDALVLNVDDPEIDDIDDRLLLRLLEVSIQCAADNDKVKMSAMRGLGNILRIIKQNNLQRDPQFRVLCEAAIGKLLDCACKVSNMKVRWNACYAMGNAMKNDDLFTCFSGWQSQVFPNLCSLTRDCKNLKVRINAAVALRAPTTRAQYGELFPLVWRGVMAAMENAANVDDFTEYRHKDNLIEQLSVTLAHLCCLLKQTDLPEILDPLVFHYDCAKSLLTQLCHKLPPENSSCLRILEAAKYVTVDLTAANDTQSQSLSMLQDIFIWDM